jgi:quercetin dioxygenase-like cupin family protein/DNA-binding XRE family transcriptional regulator
VDAERSLGAVVRARREALGRSLRATATAAEVSPSFLSQLENGHSLARVETLHRIARALDTTVHELLGATAVERGVSVTRAARGAVVQQSDDPEEGVVRSLVSGRTVLQAIEIRGAPPTFGDFYEHDGTEMMYVVSGQVEVQVGAKRHRLGPGDAITYPAHVRHRTRRLAGPVHLVVVTTAG